VGLLAAIEHVDQLAWAAPCRRPRRRSGSRPSAAAVVRVSASMARRSARLLAPSLVGRHRAHGLGRDVAELAARAGRAWRPCRRSGRSPWLNRPRAPGGEAIRYMTLRPPADSPAMVTLAGSPPKAAMLLLDPAQGRDLVQQAVVARDVVRRLRAELGMGHVAQHAQAVVDRDDDQTPAWPGPRRRTSPRCWSRRSANRRGSRPAPGPSWPWRGVQTFSDRQSSLIAFSGEE
jgi:hypothetical protein